MKKQCSECKELKDLSMFAKSKGAKDNLYPYCKTCSRVISKLYRVNNRKKELKRQRRFYHANKDRLQKVSRDYYDRNKETMQKTSREYHRKNRESILASEKIKRDLEIKELKDRYIKQLICNMSNLSHKDIPQEMVEAKREHLKLKRIIREDV